jgi:addiction module RelE/StbE family toxin
VAEQIRVMIVKFTNHFRRQYKKADVRIRKRLEKRLEIFIKNPNDPQLRNHPLRGEYEGKRSIDITSDWRAIYREPEKMGNGVIVHFTALGTHSQLYG